MRVAREAARRIELPAATSFVFDEEGGDGGELGASPAAAAGGVLSTGTPAVVEQAWNLTKQVNMIIGSDELVPGGGYNHHTVEQLYRVHPGTRGNARRVP